MVSKTSALHQEILQVVDNVAREKDIPKEPVFEAIEMAIQRAGRAKYGQDYDIRAAIDRKTGSIDLRRYREVVDIVENDATQILLKDAQKTDPSVQVGDFVNEVLPPIDLGRVSAQIAKQVIVQKVRDAEREKQYEEFKGRIGEIVNGIVKRSDFGGVIVDLGRTEAVIRKEEMIPRETFKNNDRVRAYIYDVRRENHGPQILLSRTHPGFLAKLFMQEVPEIYEGVIEIKSVARDPGSRAKIAVYTADSSLDPIGACVGIKGSRVQAVTHELQGEKIDIIQWSSDPAKALISALTPAEVSKVVIDEANRRVEVVVGEEQLSLAIGRRGQNVKLASMLTGWDIDILTEEQESTRRQEEFQTRSKLFIEALDVDDVIAHLLVTEGFVSIEEIANEDIESLAKIEGFDLDVAQELQNRALQWITSQKEQVEKEKTRLGIGADLAEILAAYPSAILIHLGEHGIKTLDDLADLASDELLEILPEHSMTQDQANKLIMAARSHWFDDEGKI